MLLCFYFCSRRLLLDLSLKDEEKHFDTNGRDTDCDSLSSCRSLNIPWTTLGFVDRMVSHVWAGCSSGSLAQQEPDLGKNIWQNMEKSPPNDVPVKLCITSLESVARPAIVRLHLCAGRTPEYWPLIGRDRSRDPDTGLWLVVITIHHRDTDRQWPKPLTATRGDIFTQAWSLNKTK